MNEPFRSARFPLGTAARAKSSNCQKRPCAIGSKAFSKIPEAHSSFRNQWRFSNSCDSNRLTRASSSTKPTTGRTEMADTRISQLLNIERRFLRSAHLQRDFQDPAALDGYIVTPAIKANFDRIRRGMTPGSGQRAWRVTGDYGSGKSSFALLLANLFAGRDSNQISQIRRTLDLSRPSRQVPFS